MKFHHQTKFHKQPSPDDRGNCLKTCIACLMDLEMNEVPDFDPANPWPAVWEFLAARGWECKLHPIDQGHPDGPHLCQGQSPRGIYHAVIYWGRSLHHDPHPSGAGINNVDMIHIVRRRQDG